MSPTPPAHWLFFPPPTFLAAHAPVKVVYTLAIHLFVFHHDKLLLLHDTSTSKWTVPTRQVVAKDFSSREFRGNPNLPCNMVFSTDEASTAHVSLVHLVLRMLRNPIEERTLEGLQFLDLVSGRPRIDVVNQSTLRLCLHLSVARAGLELVPGRGVVINGPSTYKDLRWIELSEVEAVPLAGKAKELVQGAFETLRRIRVSYQKLREGERPEIAERVRDGSLLISTMVRSVVLGGLITHAVVTVGQSAPELGLFLMEVDAEIVEEVSHRACRLLLLAIHC